MVFPWYFYHHYRIFFIKTFISFNIHPVHSYTIIFSSLVWPLWFRPCEWPFSMRQVRKAVWVQTQGTSNTQQPIYEILTTHLCFICSLYLLFILFFILCFLLTLSSCFFFLWICFIFSIIWLYFTFLKFLFAITNTEQPLWLITFTGSLQLIFYSW